MPPKPKRQYTMPGAFDKDQSDSDGEVISDAGSKSNDKGVQPCAGINTKFSELTLRPHHDLSTGANDASDPVHSKKSREILKTVSMNSYFWRPEQTPPSSLARSVISSKNVWTPWSNKFIRPQDSAKFEAIRLHKIDTWISEIDAGMDLVGDALVYIAETNETYGDYQLFNALPITPVRLAYTCDDSASLVEWRASRKLLLQESSMEKTFLPSIILKVHARHTHPDRKINTYKKSVLSSLNLQHPSQCIAISPKEIRASLQELKNARSSAEYSIMLLQTLVKAKTPCAQWLLLDLIEGHTSTTSPNMASLLSLHQQHELQSSISRFCELKASISNQVSEKQITLLQIQEFEVSKSPPTSRFEHDIALLRGILRRIHEAMAFAWILRNGFNTLGEHHAERIRPVVAKFVYDNFLTLRPHGRFFNFEMTGVDEAIAEERAKNSAFRPPVWMPEEVQMAWAEITKSVAWREGIES